MNLLKFDNDKTALHINSIIIVRITTDSACALHAGILVAPQDNHVEVSGEPFCLSKPAIP